MFASKIVPLIMLLLVSYGLVVVLIRRLADTVRQIGELRGELQRNDERLHARLEQLQSNAESQQPPAT